MFLFRLQNRHFLMFDLILLAMAPSLAVALRDEATGWHAYASALLWFTLLALIVKLPIFFGFRLYQRYWRFASMDELINIGLAAVTATLIITGVFLSGQWWGLMAEAGFPRSVFLLDGILTLLFVGGTRFSVRAAEYYRMRRIHAPNCKRVLIVGAGNAGTLMAREMQTNPRACLEPVGFVDDDPEKQGMRICGLPVLGSRHKLPELVKEFLIGEVIIAMPTAPGKVIREVARACEAVGVPCKTLPGIYELVSGQVKVTRLRSVEIEDLLRRVPVQVDMSSVSAMLTGQRLLVTGAGGSIGSELCRQIVRCRPAQLTVLGHGENSLFHLANELGRLECEIGGGFHLDLQVVVADVRDRSRLEAVFRRLWPQMVFHAAAHKHVPLMETNLEDAVTNNVLGTRNVVELSEAFGVQRFVMISSDKAVNPVSVMGATKRTAELVVGEVARRAACPYVTVRFGNVLGSRGSVVPLFRQQIAAGGPVTVTHPEMKRYFMTIPEAVQLVLQAGALSQNGEVFVLDMGQPVKIADLARDLIELSGYEVGRDIDIVFTGLRPGEKLFEELFLRDEDYHRTQHTHIFAARQGHAAGAALQPQVDSLIDSARHGRTDEVRRWLKAIVPEYNPPPMMEQPVAAEGLKFYPVMPEQSLAPQVEQVA